MHIDILTLFPQMFESPLSSAIFKRAADRGMVEVKTHDIRDFTHDRHRTTDDYPYGGGAGMVLKPEPVFEACEAVMQDIPKEELEDLPVVLLTPQGRPFSQQLARELSEHKYLILICGHYEGVDERVRKHLATDEISIGDYVLSGGELAAMVVADAVVRLVPGVLGSDEAHLEESYTEGLLEYPQYTRPPVYRGWEVPEMLLSGNHAEIARWRRRESVKRTAERRPELLDEAELSPEEKEIIKGLHKE